MGVQLPSEPITRKEQYLAKAAGQAVEVPAEPITREEAYLEAIANAGGGGGGTDDYNDLKNQPQIGGNTLIGNKTASDLGLVAAETGKGLSTNDYTDADKAIVGGVTTALAGKQGTLTAGKYINIDANNEISVEREIPDEEFTYTIQQIGDGIVKITKTVSGAVVFEETYNGNADVTLDALHYVYNNGVQSYTLLIASDTHDAGFKQAMSWWARDTYTENFSTVDHSGEKLVIKSELDAAVDAIKDGTNINSFADVETALALKQDETDNTLQTTDKTVVGAINEHEGDISSLMSGLTNVDVALSVPEGTGKNVLPLTLAKLKANNTDGVWSGNTYTHDNVEFTVQTDDNDKVISVNVNGTASANTFIILDKGNFQKYKGMILNGCPFGGSGNTYNIVLQKGSGDYLVYATDIGNGYTLPNTITSDDTLLFIRIFSGYNAENLIFKPMIRPATITDPTFAPYIPSVESRIEAVESGVTGLLGNVVLEPYQAPGSDPFAVDGSGYLLKVKYQSTLLGYLVFRPKGYANPAGRKVAIELFDSGWHGVWEVYRDYPE